MSITIKDIARILNVSHTTVSRSLNDSPLISDETKERVKEVARKYNYKPNVNARSLVTSKSYNLGLFFSSLKSGTTANFFLDTVKGVNSQIKGKYNLSVEAVDDLSDFDNIRPRYFDGILFMSQNEADEAIISHIVRQEIPIVVMNRESEGRKLMTILADDLAGAYELTRHIVQNGHKRLGIIEGKQEFRTSQKRKQGFLKALSEANIVHDSALAVRGNYDVASGYQGMKQLLLLNEKPTAVFCSNDEMALGAMKAITEEGYSVPGDFSIAGFDDMGFTAYLSPALTTVQRPIEAIAREGSRILIDIIENQVVLEPEIIYLDTRLVIRDSIKNIS